MRASAICVAAAAGVVASFWGGTQTQAMTARPIGILAGTPALDLLEPIHCRRIPHAHRGEHDLSRGCDTARGRRGVVTRERVRTPGSGFTDNPLKTIQSGTQPLGSGESTRVDPLRGGPNTGVPPLSGGRSTGSGGSSLGSSPGGSLGGSSSGGSSGGSSSSGSSGGSM
jgi:hypothetical protein